MSLPAGASITSIGGKRCTAVPRAATNIAANGGGIIATNANSSAVGLIAAAVPAPAATTPTVTTSAVPVLAPASTSIIPAQVTSTTVEVPTSTQQAPQKAASTFTQTSLNPEDTQAVASKSTNQPDVAASQIVSSLSIASSSLIASARPSDPPAVTAESDINDAATPTSTTSNASTPLQTSTIPGKLAGTIAGSSPTQTPGESPAESSAAAAMTISSTPQISAGPVVGGVVGGVAFFAIVAFLWWRYIRKRQPRDSMLSPLNVQFDRDRSEKYMIDENSLGPTRRSKKWKAQVGGFCATLRMDLGDFGSCLKAKFGGNNDSPSVNLNRGNSQFLEPISQHSRSNSAVSGGNNRTLTARDRFSDWWERFIADINFNWRLRKKANDPIDPFAAARSLSEKEAHSSQITPDFSQFLAIKGRELRQTADRRHRSLSTAALPQLGSLDMDFSAISDPFTDPSPSGQSTIPNLLKPPATLTFNPFADPSGIPHPLPTKPNTSDYVANVRRSRGLSESIPTNSGPATRYPPSIAANVTPGPRYPSTVTATNPVSRYPSTIRSSRGSYRDTVMSAFSTSGRKTKARSDPFDLERPELWRPPNPPFPQNQAGNARTSTASQVSSTGATNGSAPTIESVHTGRPRIISEDGTYSSSKYSSGISAMLSEWGDPGPDLGPGALRRVSVEEGSGASMEARRGSVSNGSTGSGGGATVGRAL